MKVVVSKFLKITGCTPYEIRSIKEVCTFPNPAYKAYKEKLKINSKLAFSEPEPDEFIYSYKENKDGSLIVPTYLFSYLNKNFLVDIEDDLRVKPKLEHELSQNFTYRPGQKEAVDALVKANHGLICAPCGSGKTTILCGLIKELNTTSLVLVHTQLLLNQTIKEIENKLGYKAGKIGAGVYDLRPITVATVQTLNKKGVSEELSNYFGLIAADECQFFAAPTFINVIQSFNAKHKYGASATPTRADGLDLITEQTIGTIVHKIDNSVPIKAGNILKPSYEFITTTFKPYKHFGAWEWPAHLNCLVRNKKRNEFIISQIRKKINGYTLILTDRIEHGNYLLKELEDLNPIYYNGKLSEKEKKNIKNSWENDKPRLTIATTDSIGVGTDVPFWEEVWLTTPTSNFNRLTQIIGRVARAYPGKNHCKIYDFRDSLDLVLEEKAKKREEIYKNL